MRGYARWFGILLAGGVAAAQIPVAQVKIEGLRRLGQEPVVRASGIKAGQTVSTADLGSAGQTLFDTGMFTSVTYSYTPVEGNYIVAFQVIEDAPDSDVRIDVPGVDEAVLWNDLQSVEPLVSRRMPHNERALDFACRAVERALALRGRHETIAATNSVDLKTRHLEITLGPENPPTVSDVRFEGTHALSAGEVRDAIAKLVIGNRYSEREFRQVLDLNVRPLYEDRGYLKVDFPAVRLTPAGGDLAVDVQVNEGSVWILGMADLAGPALPEEAMRKAAAMWDIHTANWKQITDAIERMRTVLRHEGYLEAKANPIRRFRADGRTVDLRVEVEKGPQFVFGALTIGGVTDRDRARLEKLFRLKPGDPLDQPYLEDYLKECLDLLGRTVKKFDSRLMQRPGTHLMDVTLTFQ